MPRRIAFVTISPVKRDCRGADLKEPFVVDTDGSEIRISRTGYTGEQVCFELLIPRDNAPVIWDLLIEKGATPTGLGARRRLTNHGPRQRVAESARLPIGWCQLEVGEVETRGHGAADQRPVPEAGG